MYFFLGFGFFLWFKHKLLDYGPGPIEARSWGAETHLVRNGVVRRHM